MNLLSEIATPRYWNTAANRASADIIKQKLEGYNLDRVYFEDFNNSGSGRNVIGEIGSGNKYFVIGAHRDSVNNCNGSVDNAAGTVSVLEAARILSTCKSQLSEYTIRFVLFDGEEVGYRGSLYYIQNHSAENTTAMANFDCTGETNASTLRVYRNNYNSSIALAADNACQYLETTGMPACSRMGNGTNSDHMSFKNAGIEYIWTTNNNICGQCLHCSSCADNMSRIGLAQLTWAGRFAVYTIADSYLK